MSMAIAACLWDFSIFLFIVAPPILWLFAAVTGKSQTMDAQEYHQWRDAPQVGCAIAGAFIRAALSVFSCSHPCLERVARIGSLEWCLDMMLGSARRSLTGDLMLNWLWRRLRLTSSLSPTRWLQMPFRSALVMTTPFHRWWRRPRQESEPQRPGLPKSYIEELIRLYFDDDVVSPQGAERLLDLQTLMNVQYSAPRTRDTVSLSEAFTDPEPQQAITPRNAAQPLRDTHGTNTGNASESPTDNFPQTFPERLETSVEVSGTTSSEGDVCAADVGTIASANSLRLILQGPQTRATGSRDWLLTLHRPTTTFIDRTVPASTSTPDQGTTDAVGADLSGGGRDLERRGSGLDPPVTDVAAVDNNDTAQTPRQTLTAPPRDQVNSSVGNAETDPGSTPVPNHAATDTAGANLSGDGNDLERRSSGVDPTVKDATAADSDDTAQTPRQPLTVPLRDQVNSSAVNTQSPRQPLTATPNDQVNSSVSDAGTNPDSTPSPSSSRQAAIDGVGTNRDASSSKNTLSSGAKWFGKIVAGSVDYGRKSLDKAFAPCHTEEEIIEIAARDYDLEHLKNGVTMDEYNQRIDKWKEIEDSIVRREPPYRIPDPLDYGQEWQVFHALQLWFYYALHRRENRGFPPGYRTLFGSSEEEIYRRSSPIHRLWQRWR